MSKQETVSEHLAWMPEQEGQLAVDVLEDETNLYIISAIAGVPADDLDIAITHDTVTIRGRREEREVLRPETTIHLQECYWGAFSRSIVLPHNVRPENADAVLQNGILTITIPKTEGSAEIEVVEW